MPPVLDARNVYSEITPDKLQSRFADVEHRVFVPNGMSNTVTVINAKTRTVTGTFRTQREPQHIVPAYDMNTLWVLNNQGYDVIPVNPITGTPGAPIKVADPYNLYFSPDGKFAIVVAEAFRRLDFYTADFSQRVGELVVPECAGINHGDWSADGSYALFTCEFNGNLAKIDIPNRKVLGYISLDPKFMPQDLRVGPDGRTFYVADMVANGVHIIDGPSFTKTGFVPTGVGAHGLTISRDAQVMYVANRGSSKLPGRAKAPGGVSVFSFATNSVITTIEVPHGGSPDMGNMNPEGTELWLSGRYDNEVYVFDITRGKEAFATRIKVDKGPHGLTYFPQPGRYSLGHTGNIR
jgi:YVTN family beta-propeller protein